MRLSTGGQGTFAGTGGGLRVPVDGEDRQNRIPDETQDLTIVRKHRATGAFEVVVERSDVIIPRQGIGHGVDPRRSLYQITA